MQEVLVFSEIEEVAFEMLSWGRNINESAEVKLSAVILGENAGAKTASYFNHGADKVYLSENTLLSSYYGDIYAEALYQIIKISNPELVLIGSTRRGKELAPRVAQKWNAACVTDAIALEINDNEFIASRYTLGGATVSIGTLNSPRKVISVMPRVFKSNTEESEHGEIVEVPLTLQEPKLKIVEKKAKEGGKANLEEAEVMVCVGRGVSKKEDLASVEVLAKTLNAEIGCTRPLSHDWHWLSEEREVGLSGKKCKPRLCISLGISGQIQHVVGIRDAKIIVAINKDKSAPIFEIADYGLVGNLYEAVPLLVESIRRVK